jgi:hypothetical protein
MGEQASLKAQRNKDVSIEFVVLDPQIRSRGTLIDYVLTVEMHGRESI